MFKSKCLVLVLMYYVALARSQESSELQCVSTVVVTSSRNQSGHWAAQVTTHRDNSTQCESAPTYQVQLSIIKASAPLNCSSLSNSISPPLPGYSRLLCNGCYKYHTAATTWTQAKDICNQEGGHLVIVNSEEETDAMRRLIKVNAAQVTGTKDSWERLYSWVGVVESDKTQNQFFTLFGEPLSETGYTVWRDGYPKQSTLGDVVFFFSGDGSLWDARVAWKWRFPFACEQRSC